MAGVEGSQGEDRRREGARRPGAAALRGGGLPATPQRGWRARARLAGAAHLPGRDRAPHRPLPVHRVGDRRGPPRDAARRRGRRRPVGGRSPAGRAAVPGRRLRHPGHRHGGVPRRRRAHRPAGTGALLGAPPSPGPLRSRWDARPHGGALRGLPQAVEARHRAARRDRHRRSQPRRSQGPRQGLRGGHARLAGAGRGRGPARAVRGAGLRGQRRQPGGAGRALVGSGARGRRLRLRQGGHRSRRRAHRPQGDLPGSQRGRRRDWPPGHRPEGRPLRLRAAGMPRNPRRLPRPHRPGHGAPARVPGQHARRARGDDERHRGRSAGWRSAGAPRGGRGRRVPGHRRRLHAELAEPREGHHRRAAWPGSASSSWRACAGRSPAGRSSAPSPRPRW